MSKLLEILSLLSRRYFATWSTGKVSPVFQIRLPKHAPLRLALRRSAALCSRATFVRSAAQMVAGTSIRLPDRLMRRTSLFRGAPVETDPWMGSRPCFADSRPVIGHAAKHPGLWLAFGHGHWGLTLGPVTGRLIAELVTGVTPFCDPAPYAAERFV